VKIADFGLGKVSDGYNSPVRSVVGSPVYVAPEVLHIARSGEGSYDSAVDMWSLGVVLYVMLCGAYPFSTREIPKEVTVGSVLEIQCSKGKGVNSVAFRHRNGHLCSSGTPVEDEETSPYLLQDDEAVVAVYQEQSKEQHLIAASLTLFFSNQRYLCYEGADAVRVQRFRAKPGQQISGLVFEGSKLCRVETTGVDRASKGVVQSISGWAGDALDGVALEFKDGKNVVYGGTGGVPVGPWTMEPTELILFVEQEYRADFLGNSLVFQTSKRRIVALEGKDACKTARFAAPVGVQIDGLNFEGTELTGVASTPPEKEMTTVNFRVDTPSWGRASLGAKEVVRGLLQVDPQKRMQLGRCLRCPWLIDADRNQDSVEGFIRRGQSRDLIKAAVQAGVEAKDEAQMSELKAQAGSSSTMAAVQHISGRVGTAVDRVSFCLRTRNESATYGTQEGGSAVGPWALAPAEFIIAVMQEQTSEPPNYLGVLLAFFTSAGGVITVAGHAARHRSFFAAARGQEIRGLSFEGPQLAGIEVSSVAPNRDRGIIAEVRWWAAAAIDCMEFRRRDGSCSIYGEHGGHEKSSFHLQPDESIVAVCQEYRGQYLGNSMVFFTSKGNVFSLVGFHGTSANCYAVADGLQVRALRFDDSGVLVGVETSKAG